MRVVGFDAGTYIESSIPGMIQRYRGHHQVSRFFPNKRRRRRDETAAAEFNARGAASPVFLSAITTAPVIAVHKVISVWAPHVSRATYYMLFTSNKPPSIEKLRIFYLQQVQYTGIIHP